MREDRRRQGRRQPCAGGARAYCILHQMRKVRAGKGRQRTEGKVFRAAQKDWKRGTSAAEQA